MNEMPVTPLLPGVLPPDLIIQLAEHLKASEAMHTLASLLATSKTNYELLLPMLHEHRTLGTGLFSLDRIIAADSTRPPSEPAQPASRADKLFTAHSTAARNRLHMRHIKALHVDTITLAAHALPDPSGPLALPNVDTVIFGPAVLGELAELFTLELAERFLHPLASVCAPTHLALHLPEDNGAGSLKILHNVLDELRWPQLEVLSLFNVGAHAIPSRAGLHVDVEFSDQIPAKWNAGHLAMRKLLPRYERSRFTQIVMAIARSVRLQDAPDSMGGMGWKFAGAGTLLGEKYAKGSGERVGRAVMEWVEREYSAAGWTEGEVEGLLGRISFAA